MPFKLKRGPVTEAIKKGIMFEICYSAAIEGNRKNDFSELLDSTLRRMVFSNAIQIIKATKGKNLIFSSGCKDPFYHRGPYDIICL
jgi:ribonuclease P/MRP protein subunit RPP1